MNFVEYLHEIKGVKPAFPDQYGEWLGYSIDQYDREKGEVVTRLTIRDEHLSPSQAVHGGVVSGFLDFSCGCAVFTKLEAAMLCSTVDLSVKYFKPLKKADEVIATAKVLHKGSHLSSAIAHLYLAKDGVQDNLLAMAMGTFNLYQAPAHIVAAYQQSLRVDQ